MESLYTSLYTSLKTYIDTSSFWTLIGVILGSFLTYFFSSIQVKRKEKQETIEVASIIYFDMNRSMRALILQGENENEVLENKFTELAEQYQNIIIKMRDKLLSHELNNLLIYYSNLSLLEDKRIEYWKADSDVTIQFQLKKFLNIYTLVRKDSDDNLKSDELLLKIKKIAKVKF